LQGVRLQHCAAVEEQRKNVVNKEMK